MLTRLFIIALASLILPMAAGGIAGTASLAQEDDPEAVYDAWADALETDFDASMSFWADDAVISDVAAWDNLIVGKPAIALILQSEAVTTLTTEQLTRSVEDNTVVTTEHWSDATSEAAGVDRYAVETTVTVEDGKIKRFDIRYDRDDEQTNTYLDYVLARGAEPFPGSTEFALGGEQPATGFVYGLGDVTFIEVHASQSASATPWSAALSSGTCASAGATVLRLADVLNGVSFTLLSTPLSSFGGSSAIHLSRQTGSSSHEVSCGAVPAIAEPAPAAPAPTAPAGQVVAAPNTGSGFTARSGGDPVAVAAALMAILGVALILGRRTSLHRRRN
jgi:hypothetical protein